ncbi:MAG: PriCT-2 domain-containing protein [Oscillospiraceae bacterium]|nr:PriCT-2 domain-containing protein [Clostridia bacterium]MBQ6431826.1 PriCT-2 domain-containing protein [Oscillospiraceae bacterium]
MNKYDIMLDGMIFPEKPTQEQAKAITTRFRTAQPQTVTVEQLAQAIERGQTLICGVLQGGKKAENWQRQQLFAVDFDNTVTPPKPQPKRRATPEEGALTPEDALQICSQFQIRPALAYWSFSDQHDAPEPWQRFRLIFALDREITDRAEHEKIARWLIEIFGGKPAIDEGCTNKDRLFYGSRPGSVFRVEDVQCSTAAILAEIRQHEAALAEIQKLEKAERELNAKRQKTTLPDYNPEDFNAQPDALLDLINPNGLSYTEWVSVGAAYRAAGGSLEKWLSWCAQYEGNKPRQSEKVFTGTCRGTGTPATIATLKHYAQQHDATRYRGYIEDLNAKQKAAIEAARQKKKEQEQLSGKSEKKAFTIEALAQFLDEHKIRCRYNDIQHIIEVDGIPEQYQGEHSQAQAGTIILSLLRAEHVKGAGVNLQNVESYIEVIASQKHFNPVAEALNGIVWDGRSRVQDLIAAMNLPEDDTLSPVLVRKWLRQAISLAMFNDYRRPFGADGVLVLCGPQGCGKTTFARTLGINPQLFKGGLCIDPRDKDTLLKATSCFVGEIGELETTMKRDIPALKSFLTAESDEIRRPYGRTTEKTTRRSSFIATCNSSDFLLDQTGNRRFWTVPCSERFNLAALDEMNVVQLWAEVLAKVRLTGPQSFRLSPSELDQLEQRNGAHTALIPAQAEILDILEMTRDNSAYKYIPMNATQFKEAWPVLKHYSTGQIGKALTACGIPEKRIKRNGHITKDRLLPMMHFDSVGQIPRTMPEE